MIPPIPLAREAEISSTPCEASHCTRAYRQGTSTEILGEGLISTSLMSNSGVGRWGGGESPWFTVPHREPRDGAVGAFPAVPVVRLQ